MGLHRVPKCAFARCALLPRVGYSRVSQRRSSLCCANAGPNSLCVPRRVRVRPSMRSRVRPLMFRSGSGTRIRLVLFVRYLSM
ncbi:hypothetical protein CERSUDRAFT_116039 [Gelatoporia subvermispora B]|uniref:Uncharacterized protein n=1 Tax=Ceriporiopsis subvermispora (strain B) TaxID=914234 RepID=M2QVK0_CERS8|nr:hypothetical protein CERSUDRAFT_116039 [Gelatoporia subvermispora B]